MNAWKDPKCAPKKYLGNFDKFLASKMQKEKVVLIPNIYQCLNNSRIIQPLSSSTCKMTSEYFLPLIYKNNRRQVFYIICLLINFDEVSSMKLFFQQTATFLLDTGRKLNVHKTFRRRPWCLLNVLCKFNLHFVPKTPLYVSPWPSLFYRPWSSLANFAIFFRALYLWNT